MRHYVLTRAAYGPNWSLEANRRRLDLTRGITASLMAQQTHRDWTWLVLLDERDPLLAERMSVFREAAPRFEPLLWHPTKLGPAPWDRRARARLRRVEQIAAAAYKAPWSKAIGDRDDWVLQTRIDDDDGFTPDGLERMIPTRLTRRSVLMAPVGYRTWAGRIQLVYHDTNAMHALATPPGDRLCIYDYGHRNVRRVAPVRTVDRKPAWLWVRHQDTLSGWKTATGRITDEIRALFPIDWSVLEVS